MLKTGIAVSLLFAMQEMIHILALDFR